MAILRSIGLSIYPSGPIHHLPTPAVLLPMIQNPSTSAAKPFHSTFWRHRWSDHPLEIPCLGSQNLLLQMGLTNLRPGSKRSIKKGPQNSQTRDDSKENGQPKSSKRKLQKFQKKVQFYSKVKDTSLAAKKPIQKKKRLRSRQKKLKAYDLSSLSELLPDLNAKQQLPNADAPKLKLNCKNRQKLLVMETERFKEIMSNPIFQSDPLKFIQQHLENTLPPVSNQEDKRDRTGKKDKKKRKKGSSSDTQSMDI